MSFFDDLISKGRDFLGMEEKPPTETEAIKRNSFDRDDWAKVREAIPQVAQSVTNLGKTVDYAEDIAGDLHAMFYKVDPHLRTPEEMKPTHVANQAVAEHMLNLTEVHNLRQHSSGDLYGSAMAMIAVREALQETVTRATQAAQEAVEQQQAEQEARDKAAADFAEMMQAMQDNPLPEDHPGNQIRENALQEALDKLGTMPAPNPAGAQQAAQQAAKGMENKIRSAAKKATDQLDEEADLINAFGVEPGELKKMNVKERMALAKRLRGNRLAAFTKLLGQFRTVQQAESRKRVVNAASEVHGITQSNHLERMVPGEILNLAHPALKALMYLRWTEHQLNTYDVRGKEKQGQGPIIAVVDESASMNATDVAGGTREAWSKALALALLDQARRRNRDFVYIGFASSGQQHMIEFPGGHTSLDKVLTMTEHFFAGGTNFEEPLGMALKVIEDRFDKQGKPRPDIVFISDDQVGSINPTFLHEWNRIKDKTSVFAYGIAIGCSASGAMATLCDNVRSINQLVSDPRNVGDLFRTI